MAAEARGTGSASDGLPVAVPVAVHVPVPRPLAAPGPAPGSGPVVASARYGPPGGAPGVPGGVLGGAPRDADVHAVLPSQYLLPPGQASGPAARCDAAGTRDGLRDVRVFPG
ncbi:hypothetical protein QA811_20175 [Streptomyces sp. B21-102]|uniref:hypothetical protein n=1 Tax=Streptomyces sp. B21-102 TaxID=3039416 RepID=UPI002FF32447